MRTVVHEYWDINKTKVKKETIYYPDGLELDQYFDSNGVIKTTRTYWNNDRTKVKSQTQYLDGIKNVLSQHYDENGGLGLEKTYIIIDGISKGTTKIWHPNGNLKHEYELINGKIHGSWGTYYSDGKVKSNVFYQNGEKRNLSIFEQALNLFKTNFLFNKKKSKKPLYTPLI